jgi:guanylate kinase
MSHKNNSHNLEHIHKPLSQCGRLIVISAPSGAGKSTLCRALRQHFPNMLYSVSYTTRPPRPDEKDGKDYIFINQKEFIERINENRWAEWAIVHDNYYGTSAEDIDHGLQSGKDILLDIDVQGASQIIKRYPDSITIFIMPPDMKELRRRLEARGTDSSQTISIRMENAVKEIDQRKMYKYIIVNDRLEDSIAALLAIIKPSRSNMKLSAVKGDGI